MPKGERLQPQLKGFWSESKREGGEKTDKKEQKKTRKKRQGSRRPTGEKKNHFRRGVLFFLAGGARTSEPQPKGRENRQPHIRHTGGCLLKREGGKVCTSSKGEGKILARGCVDFLSIGNYPRKKRRKKALCLGGKLGVPITSVGRVGGKRCDAEGEKGVLRARKRLDFKAKLNARKDSVLLYQKNGSKTISPNNCFKKNGPSTEREDAEVGEWGIE